MGWEKQTGRYLKAGCKGIGVVDMDNPKATLTYYLTLQIPVAVMMGSVPQ